MHSRTDRLSYAADHAVTNASVLACENLTVRFQGLTAISGVSMAMDRHEILGLIGPNGAGKTTLVNCLTGFQAPTEGRVTLAGEDATGWESTIFRERGVARTFQAGRLFKNLSVVENVEVTATGLGLNLRQARAEATRLLKWVGLCDKSAWKAGSLAYTDQRRLGIVRSLVLSPAFILLDEPAAGMSDPECEDLMRLVSSLPKEFDCGVLLIEHNMRVVMGISNRIHVLDGGKTIAEGTPKEIQEHQAVLAAYLGEG